MRPNALALPSQGFFVGKTQGHAYTNATYIFFSGFLSGFLYYVLFLLAFLHLYYFLFIPLVFFVGKSQGDALIFFWVSFWKTKKNIGIKNNIGIISFFVGKTQADAYTSALVSYITY